MRPTSPPRVDVTDVDPVHQSSGPGMQWTRVNTGEALPGVLTALTWTFWRESMNYASRRAYVALGALPRRELKPSDDPLENFGAAFYGRYTSSLELRRRIADAIPGTSRAKDEKAVLAASGSAVNHRGTWQRYPIAIVKAPWAVLRAGRRLGRIGAVNDALWRRAVTESPGWGSHEAIEAFIAARDAFRAAMQQQAIVTFASGFLMSRIAELTARAGHPELTQDLYAGGGSLEEVGLMVDLAAAADDRLGLDDFIARHGYHGVNEGRLDGVPWRVEPKPVEVRFDALRRAAAGRAAADQQIAESRDRNRQATRSVLRGLPRWRRPAAALLIRVTRQVLPLREVAKRAFLQAIDVARIAADVRARDLVAGGVLDDRTDVHHLCETELTDAHLGREVRASITERKERYAFFCTVDIPTTWVGDPDPFWIEDQGGNDRSMPVERDLVLAGVGVGTDSVTGIARVVNDPSIDDLEPDEVLICNTTDPSWIPLMRIASAVVTDVGSALSHAAIIARELGLPGVVNVGDATVRIRTGDTVTVDAGAGTVTTTSAP